jgi:hypothetical protein
VVRARLWGAGHPIFRPSLLARRVRIRVTTCLVKAAPARYNANLRLAHRRCTSERNARPKSLRGSRWNALHRAVRRFTNPEIRLSMDVEKATVYLEASERDLGRSRESLANRASFRRAFGVKIALAWDTKASWVCSGFLDSSTPHREAFVIPKISASKHKRLLVAEDPQGCRAKHGQTSH